MTDITQRIPQETIDKITNNLYNEFQSTHWLLFGENPTRYWQEARKYVEERSRIKIEEIKKQMRGEVRKKQSLVGRITYSLRRARSK